MAGIDATHSPKLKSWVPSADGHSDFPIQNLPLGVFSPRGKAPRGGVAIGERIFDIAAAADANLFSGDAKVAARAAAGDALNEFLALDAPLRAAFRKRVSELLSADGKDRAKVEKRADKLVHRAGACTLSLPVEIGSYTDFFAGIHHARNGPRRRDPNADVAPNYKYVPIAYHGRHSSIVASGTPIRRPNVQYVPLGSEAPTFGPCTMLDFELELAIWVGKGNDLGKSVPIAKAGAHIAGFGLFNDWSARDTQVWESTLGPFQAKNFASVVSPWIVTVDALAPFTKAQWREPGDPPLLPHLNDAKDQKRGAYDVVLGAYVSTAEMRRKKLPPFRLALSSTSHLYWTPAQMLAHHTAGGCNLAAGDLFGSGTISGPDPSGFGSLAELSWGGEKRIELPSGETRTFLEDDDEITLRGHAERPGHVRIGLGACVSRVLEAR